MGECSSKTELQFGLSSPVQGLVDLRILRVKSNVGSFAVREAFKDDFLSCGNGEEEAKLLGQSVDEKISQRDLEFPVAILKRDLDSDQGVQRDGDIGSHVDSGATLALVVT